MFSWANSIHWQDVTAILVVVAVLSGLLLSLRGTLGIKVLIGLLLILSAFLFARWTGLYRGDWLGRTGWPDLVLAILILFHPEIRRVLARVGQLPFSRTLNSIKESRVIDEIVKAVMTMATRRIGAILVFERQLGLKDIVEMGVQMDALLSKELLLTLFQPASPLHDGAVIIKEGRIVAAGCFLPLTLRSDTDSQLGTRHRAALGLAEESDAVIVVVSEEAGTISLVRNGEMIRELEANELRRHLVHLFLDGEGVPDARRRRRLNGWLSGWPVRRGLNRQDWSSEKAGSPGESKSP